MFDLLFSIMFYLLTMKENRHTRWPWSCCVCHEAIDHPTELITLMLLENVGIWNYSQDFIASLWDYFPSTHWHFPLFHRYSIIYWRSSISMVKPKPFESLVTLQYHMGMPSFPQTNGEDRMHAIKLTRKRKCMPSIKHGR